MKVWKKNYLIAISIFVVVFNVAMYFVSANVFHIALEREHISGELTRMTLSRAMMLDFQRLETPDYGAAAAEYGDRFMNKGLLMRVEVNGETVYSTIPREIASADIDDMELREFGGRHYLMLTFLALDGGSDYVFSYAANIDGLYSEQMKSMLTLVIVSLLVSAFVAVVLYFCMRMINRPLDKLSHEIRTPLTSITGYAQYLLTANPSEEQRRRALEYILLSSRQVTEISEKILIMSGLKEGQLRMKRVRAQELLADLKTTYPDLECSAEQEFIAGDPGLLFTLISNLVTNALRASSGTDSPVSVVIGGDCIIVSDHGCGMTREQLAQANSRRRIRRARGNGVGLQLARQIAELHGAKLSYVSSPERGTTVTLRLPSCQPEEDYVYPRVNLQK